MTIENLYPTHEKTIAEHRKAILDIAQRVTPKGWNIEDGRNFWYDSGFVFTDGTRGTRCSFKVATVSERYPAPVGQSIGRRIADEVAKLLTQHWSYRRTYAQFCVGNPSYVKVVIEFSL